MKLIDDICIILKPGVGLFEKELGYFHPDVHFSFLIDQTNLKDISEIYKYLHKWGKDVKISLTFNLSYLELQIIPPYDIAAFFFLPNYKFLDGNPVVNFLSFQNETSELAKDLLVNISTRQRFGGIVFNELTLFNHFDYAKVENLHVNKVEALSRIVFERNWIEEEKFFVGASVNTEEEIQDFINWVRKYEEELQESNPQFFTLFALKRKLQNDVINLQSKIQNLSEKLTIEKTYNALLKENHQAKLLQEYYDQEYEVLPLWFKRLGHIIKFVTGKRRLHL